jgi:hypothetical protein
MSIYYNIPGCTLLSSPATSKTRLTSPYLVIFKPEMMALNIIDIEAYLIYN